MLFHNETNKSPFIFQCIGYKGFVLMAHILVIT